MVHAILMSEQYRTADSTRFLILSILGPLFHVILFWILSFVQQVTMCEDFVHQIISDLCDVYLCVFSAFFLSQLALLIWHFLFKPISRRSLIASAISLQ
ncbi:hypothetical protein PRIPAC_79782 [Pristionchus pacificus]|uniref:Uncharacterized protein n=1 Tax=Pristionchus pacificus TaxID=54126 RepID=A0A2A6CPU5_PRIPA|nr:hypothetical protein PRIPAC_79782 [Pristionchus pacificus]|eukprot:PDM80140.1 hypothetical protein PRIPAC_32719 [Pristionchus pacificus]